MINHILDNVYISDWNEAKLNNHLFDVIITTAKDSPWVGDRLYPMVDGPYLYNYDLMKSAINDILAVRDDNNNMKILVHCISGVSRSTCVVAGYMIAKYSIDVDDAIYKIRKIRPIANPVFELVRLLKVYEEERVHNGIGGRV